MNVGFIGTGSMGSILIEALIGSNALRPEQIIISNRTPDKAERLVRQYPGLCAARTNRDVVMESEVVFLCVKPLEYKSVIGEIRSAAQVSQIIVSITSPVMIRQLEQHLTSKIAKVIPSMTNFVFSGVTLCMFGSRMSRPDCELIERMLRPMSTPLHISEAHARIASDLSSCGPAFLSFFLQQFIEAAVLETGISEEAATRLACEMALGTGKLLTSGKFDPVSLQARISVPGGITAKALQLMDSEMNGMFRQLIRTTHDKYDEDVTKVASLLNDATFESCGPDR